MGPLEVLILLVLVGSIGALVVTGMKGRWVFFVLGLLVTPVAFIGAALPAKPESQWARGRTTG